MEDVIELYEVREPEPGSRECRWIDERGGEWLFRRDGDALVIVRPALGGAVRVQFADLAEEGSGTHHHRWRLYGNLNGYRLRCTVCRELRVVQLDKPTDCTERFPTENPRTCLEEDDDGL